MPPEKNNLATEKLIDKILLCVAIVFLCGLGLVSVYQKVHTATPARSKSAEQPLITPIYDGKHIPTVGKTLLATITNRGSRQLGSFTAPQYWNVYWHYICNQGNKPNNFAISPIGEHGAKNLKIITGPGGSAYGNQQYKTAGYYHLVVKSDANCTWEVTVKTTY